MLNDPSDFKYKRRRNATQICTECSIFHSLFLESSSSYSLSTVSKYLEVCVGQTYSEHTASIGSKEAAVVQVWFTLHIDHEKVSTGCSHFAVWPTDIFNTLQQAEQTTSSRKKQECLKIRALCEAVNVSMRTLTVLLQSILGGMNINFIGSLSNISCRITRRRCRKRQENTSSCMSDSANNSEMSFTEWFN